MRAASFISDDEMLRLESRTPQPKPFISDEEMSALDSGPPRFISDEEMNAVEPAVSPAAALFEPEVSAAKSIYGTGKALLGIGQNVARVAPESSPMQFVKAPYEAGRAFVQNIPTSLKQTGAGAFNAAAALGRMTGVKGMVEQARLNEADAASLREQTAQDIAATPGPRTLAEARNIEDVARIIGTEAGRNAANQAVTALIAGAVKSPKAAMALQLGQAGTQELGETYGTAVEGLGAENVNMGKVLPGALKATAAEFAGQTPEMLAFGKLGKAVGGPSKSTLAAMAKKTGKYLAADVPTEALTEYQQTEWEKSGLKGTPAYPTPEALQQEKEQAAQAGAFSSGVMAAPVALQAIPEQRQAVASRAKAVVEATNLGIPTPSKIPQPQLLEAIAAAKNATQQPSAGAISPEAATPLTASEVQPQAAQDAPTATATPPVEPETQRARAVKRAIELGIENPAAKSSRKLIELIRERQAQAQQEGQGDENAVQEGQGREVAQGIPADSPAETPPAGGALAQAPPSTEFEQGFVEPPKKKRKATAYDTSFDFGQNATEDPDAEERRLFDQEMKRETKAAGVSSLIGEIKKFGGIRIGQDTNRDHRPGALRDLRPPPGVFVHKESARHADSLAEELGYESGNAMIEALRVEMETGKPQYYGGDKYEQASVSPAVKAEPASAPAIPIETVKRQFPTAVIEPVGTGYGVSFPEHNNLYVHIQPTGEIKLGASGAKSLAEHGPGAETRKALGSVVLGSREALMKIVDTGAMPHENLHLFAEYMAKPEEIVKLREEFSDNWEKAADDYREWFDGRASNHADFWQRVMDFLVRLANVVTTTKGGIYREIESGRGFQREVGGERAIKESLAMSDRSEELAAPEKASLAPAEPASDAAYMAAVERGDVKTAQKMVDEAAKRAGYSEKVWHGTDDNDFWEYETPAFFTNNILAAKAYGDKARKTYLKPGRVFSPANSEDILSAVTRETRWKYQDADYEPWRLLDQKEIRADLAEKYDTVVFEASTPEDFSGESESHHAIMAFRADNIKSASHITRDDQGNVIPLSKRFDTTSDDIRYSVSPEPPLTPEQKQAKLNKPIRTRRPLITDAKAQPLPQGPTPTGEALGQKYVKPDATDVGNDNQARIALTPQQRPEYEKAIRALDPMASNDNVAKAYGKLLDTVSLKATARRAQDLRNSSEFQQAVNEGKVKGTILNSAQINAVRDMAALSFVQMNDLRKVFEATGTVEDRLAHEKAAQVFARLKAIELGNKAEIARTLGSLRLIARAEGDLLLSKSRTAKELVWENLTKGLGRSLTGKEALEVESLEDSDYAKAYLAQHRILGKRTTLGDRFHAFQYGNILVNIMSASRSFVGNTSQKFIEEPTELLATLIDEGMGKLGKKQGRHLRAYLKAWGSADLALQGALHETGNLMKYGFTDREAQTGLDEDKFGPGIDLKGGKLNPYNWSKRLMGLTDVPFSAYRYVSASWQLATEQAIEEKQQGLITAGLFNERIREIVESGEVHEQADAIARRSTGTQRLGALSGSLNKVISWSPEALDGIRPLRVLFPFFRIAANLQKVGYEYTPIGGLQLALPSTWRRPGAAADVMARQVVGTALIYGLTLSAMAGNMTGPPPEDEKERKKWEAEGKQAYKWKIPGTETWITWNNLGMLSVPFSLAFGISELQRKHEAGEIPPGALAALEESISTVGGGLAKSFVDSSLMTSVARISDALTRGGKTAEKLIASTLSQFVPFAASQRQVAGYMDKLQRDPQGIVERIKAGVPILRAYEGVTPKTNLGEPVASKRVGSMENFFPYTKLRPDSDPVAKQYAEDMAMVEDAGVKMSPEQKRRWDVVKGKAAREAAVEFYRETSEAPSPERSEQLKRLVSRRQSEARKAFYEQEKLGKYAEE